MTLYRDMDRAALDAAYNNSLAVADSAARMADFQARSAALRAAHPGLIGLRYGPAERNRIDYFAAVDRGPVLVFIHGGYWQMRAKEDFSFLAKGLLPHGIHVAMPGYTLAPAISLSGIVAELRAAIAWLALRVDAYGGDAGRIFVAGWSAGGHLAAISLAEPAVKGALAISGIFDLTPVQLNYLNDKLKLDKDEVRRLSPLFDAAPVNKPLMIACGGAELPELQRQSAAFAAMRSAAGAAGTFANLPGHNHFTILEELASPEGELTAILRSLVAT